MKNKIKLIGMLIICSTLIARAQFPSASYFFDETQSIAVLAPNNQVVADASANGGSCIFRSASTPSETMWFGPYAELPGGNHNVSFRLKVSDNSSSAGVIFIDVVSSQGGSIYARLWVKPNMFKQANTWEFITLPVNIPNNVSGIEFRGLNFQSGIANLSLDYIQVTPGNSQGIYASDFTLTNSGMMGLGTSTPKEQLSVNGKIGATEIQVRSDGWPDYVFEPDYQMKSLSDVEIYIKQHKHLPDMPNAKTVETSGLDVGEMLKMQQKKIEELTLYLIEISKRLKAIE
ncbi:hypothetical protein ACJVDH_05585 [Pedobacter sp. AW1-32]|uniref:hypothetical protein n=1 Tax=Pedobacter sp. AW1-32 TaxID=3383026 RepID=UPI003FF0E5F6